MPLWDRDALPGYAPGAMHRAANPVPLWLRTSRPIQAKAAVPSSLCLKGPTRRDCARGIAFPFQAWEPSGQTRELAEPRQISADNAYIPAYSHQRGVDSEWPHANRLEDHGSGRLEIHIQLRVRFCEFQPEQWCAIYQRSLIP